MKSCVTDMTGAIVEMPAPARRIISVVPSQTELLYALGLEDEVAGITKFCVHPEKWFHRKTRVGGTKNLDIEKIKSLHPDLILANKEENTREQIEELQQYFPVWVSDIATVPDALQMIRRVGSLVGKEGVAQKIIRAIEKNFPGEKKVQRTAAYFIWYRPWMSVGRDTYIHDVLQRCGFRNVFAGESRYPEISADKLKAASPDLVLLSSEPFPFKEKHITEIKEILPHAAVKLVDGEMFSWYGSRMVKACSYLHTLMQTSS